MQLIWVSREAKYFCKRGWTGHFGKHEVICPSGSLVDPKGFFRHSAACATGIWTIFRQGRSDSGLRREYRAFTNLYFYNLPYGKYGGSTSALERSADSSRTSPHFRFVPTGDIAVFDVAESPSQSIEYVLMNDCSPVSVGRRCSRRGVAPPQQLRR